MLVIFDVTVESSFYSVPKWINEIREEAPENCVIMLCANKTDVAESDWKISRSKFTIFAADHNLLVFESSAVTNLNIDTVSNSLIY